jgi:hypothetical protein
MSVAGPGPSPAPTKRTPPLIAILLAFFFSAQPLANVVVANLGINAINWAVVVRLWAVGLAATALILWALRPMVRDLGTRAVFVGSFFLIMSFYGFVVFEGRSGGWNLEPGDSRLAVGYTAFSLGVALLLARPWERGRRDPTPLAMVGLAILTMNVYVVMSRTATVRAAEWRDAADRFTAVPPLPPRSVHPTRDIYYIVLDMFGRADTVNRYYGADLSGLVTFLESRGFFVADRARSNYGRTYLSLASVLNLDYLDRLVAAIGQDTQNYVPLNYVIQQNALMSLAKRAGYEVIGIGSDYQATATFRNADECDCDVHGMDGYTQTVFAATPLAAVLSGEKSHAAHRDKVLGSFDALETAHGLQPRFIFAHILLPHPPFIFSPDGFFRPPPRMLSFADGDEFPGSREEYVHGYHDQVLFAAKRLTALIESILSRDGPAPVVVVHGDHGPGSMLKWEDPAATNMAERMDIFSAYYFPDGGSQLYRSITPINGVRALANEYLGADLPTLPDRTMFSTASHPYQFIPVAPELVLPGAESAGHDSLEQARTKTGAPASTQSGPGRRKYAHIR